MMAYRWAQVVLSWQLAFRLLIDTTSSFWSQTVICIKYSNKIQAKKSLLGLDIFLNSFAGMAFHVLQK